MAALIAHDGSATLAPVHRQALQRAVVLLENPTFAARLAEYAGQPIDRVLRMLPEPATTRLNQAAEAAILNCLKLAIRSLEQSRTRTPALGVSSMLAGLSGGVGGFFGAVALPIELPVTTTLMLRAIADLARHNGEDLSTLEARLACVEVFALGKPNAGKQIGVGYYAARALLTRLTREVSAALLERGAANAATTSVVNSLLAEIASRFAVVASERAAASAIPVVGAVGGAAVNVMFMNYFQRVAHGHFTVRRLERRYGPAIVRNHYEAALRRR
jgi:hypothetical protein